MASMPDMREKIGPYEITREIHLMNRNFDDSM